MPAVKAKMTKLKAVVGDVFAGRVEDGRYGAVQVVRVFEHGQGRNRPSLVLVCTRYLGKEPPQIKDKALREVLRRKRFEFKNEPVIMNVDKPPLPELVHVGNFPPLAKTRAIDTQGRSGGGWYILHDVFLEWRWAHDRAAFEAEIEAERAKYRAEQEASKAAGPAKREPTPKSTLTEARFWALFKPLLVDGDGEIDLAPLRAGIKKLSAPDKRELRELLAHKLYLLDTKKHADHAGAAGNSDDAFLYARCHVVARGKKLFEDVLANPKRFPPDVDLEDLLAIAGEDTHYSYETGSNAAGWPR